MPGVLLLVIDCLRADLLARARASWPVASRLVGEGASFAAAYTTCPTTTPAVTAMFTGRYPWAHGVRALRGARLPEDIPTVAEELSRAGYSTFCSLTGPLLDTVGVVRGFADTEYRDRPDRSVHSQWGERIVERVGEAAAGDAPFLGVVHVWDLHTHRRYPPDFDAGRFGRNAYERALAGLDPWLGKIREAAGSETTVILTGDHGENVVLEPRNLWQQRYMSAVSRRLHAAAWGPKIAARGTRTRSKRLLRVAPRFLWNHNQTLHEELVRVPLVFAGPGLSTGSRTTPVSHVDLAPTILDLAGLPHPVRGWQGVSLAPSLRDGREPPARPIAMEIGVTPGVETVPQNAIRDGDWKLITSFDDPRVADALYNLALDPNERRNLAPRRPEVVARLKDRLREILAEKGEAEAISDEDDAVLSARLEELGYL